MDLQGPGASGGCVCDETHAVEEIKRGTRLVQMHIANRRRTASAGVTHG